VKDKHVKIPFSLIVKESGLHPKLFWLPSLLLLLFYVGILIYLVTCDIQPLIQFMNEHNNLAACFFALNFCMWNFVLAFFEIWGKLLSAAYRLRKCYEN